MDCYGLDWLEKKEYPKCPFCGKKHIWENIVDTTNGSFDDDGNRIDGLIELKVKKKITGICNNCGKEHICEITYEIPKEEKNIKKKQSS